MTKKPHPEERVFARLEGWPQTPMVRDASLRDAPHHDGGVYGARHLIKLFPHADFTASIVGVRCRILFIAAQRGCTT
jgi:hypothetical protein